MSKYIDGQMVCSKCEKPANKVFSPDWTCWECTEKLPSEIKEPTITISEWNEALDRILEEPFKYGCTVTRKGLEEIINKERKGQSEKPTNQ